MAYIVKWFGILALALVLGITGCNNLLDNTDEDSSDKKVSATSKIIFPDH